MTQPSRATDRAEPSRPGQRQYSRAYTEVPRTETGRYSAEYSPLGGTDTEHVLLTCRLCTLELVVLWMTLPLPALFSRITLFLLNWTGCVDWITDGWF